MLDILVQERRNQEAAETSLRRLVDGNGYVPRVVVTAKLASYPPAVRRVLSGVEHRRHKYLNNGLERDQSHLKQRLYPMRSFKRGAPADTLARGHALIRNLRGGCSSLSAAVTPNLRLAPAWPQLMRAI